MSLPADRGPSLSDEVLRICKPYLGLATRDLLSRICRNLLGTELERLEPAELPSLAYWIRISAQKLMAASRAEELGRLVEGASNGH